MPRYVPSRPPFEISLRGHLGIHFADASVFIVCAMSLATLNIEKLVLGGEVVEPVLEYSTGTIRSVWLILYVFIT
jgi:hypothetical protein